MWTIQRGTPSRDSLSLLRGQGFKHLDLHRRILWWVKNMRGNFNHPTFCHPSCLLRHCPHITLNSPCLLTLAYCFCRPQTCQPHQFSSSVTLLLSSAPPTHWFWRLSWAPWRVPVINCGAWALHCCLGLPHPSSLSAATSALKAGPKCSAPSTLYSVRASVVNVPMPSPYPLSFSFLPTFFFSGVLSVQCGMLTAAALCQKNPHKHTHTHTCTYACTCTVTDTQLGPSCMQRLGFGNQWRRKKKRGKELK